MGFMLNEESLSSDHFGVLDHLSSCLSCVWTHVVSNNGRTKFTEPQCPKICFIAYAQKIYRNETCVGG